MSVRIFIPGLTIARCLVFIIFQFIELNTHIAHLVDIQAAKECGR